MYYQPQLDEWKDYKQLVGRVAFSLTPRGGDAVLGVLNFQAGTIVDKESRTAFIRDITVSEVRFPSLNATNSGVMERILRPMVPTGGEPISIDRLLADLEKNDQIQARAVVVKNDPPPIYYSSRSAVLLMVDGDPVLAPIEKTDLQFIVNTNWDLFFDKSKKQYFLLVENGWLTAKELKGPWTTTQVVPKDMEKLPAGQNFDDVKKMVPPPPPSGTVPQVFFSSVPAELVLTQGAPVYTKIPGTQLLFVANTESDLFADNTARQFYILLSGRWFRSTSLAGPWTYAGNTLPADFAKIPSDSPRSRVLASVPGTVEASDAVMLAQVPTTAIVNRAEVEAKVKVTYDGAPQFKPIEGTNLQYASNTPEKVIKVGDLYYLCFQGVWFTSAKPAGSVEDGRFRAQGDLHHPAKFAGLQHHLRYPNECDGYNRRMQPYSRLRRGVCDRDDRWHGDHLRYRLLLSALCLLGSGLGISCLSTLALTRMALARYTTHGPEDGPQADPSMAPTEQRTLPPGTTRLPEDMDAQPASRDGTADEPSQAPIIHGPVDTAPRLRATTATLSGDNPPLSGAINGPARDM